MRFCGGNKIPRSISRLEILILELGNSSENALDDSTGAEITAWYAIEPGGKHDVAVCSVESVGYMLPARI